jgi:hypothetical protein
MATLCYAVLKDGNIYIKFFITVGYLIITSLNETKKLL